MVQFFILSFKPPAIVGFRDSQKTDVQKKKFNYYSGAKHRSNSDNSVGSEKFLLCIASEKIYIHYLFYI